MISLALQLCSLWPIRRCRIDEVLPGACNSRWVCEVLIPSRNPEGPRRTSMMLCWKCAIRVKTTWPVNHFMHYEQGTSLVIRPEFGTNTILTSTINRAAEIWGGHVMVMGGTEVEGQRANIVDDTRSFTPESEQTWRADPWKPAPKGSWEPGPSDPAADFAAGLEMVRRQTDEFCKRKFVRRPSTDKHHLAPSWQLRKGLR